jgi:tetratricopeptide (TPR) repeat protein
MIIRKLLLYIIIIAAFGHSCFAIDMRLINLNNVPGIEKLEDDLLFVINHEYLLHSYIPDELWAHSLSKQDLTDRLIKLSTDLEAFDETIENQDLLLLKGLICYYLFNLDQQGHYDKAVEYWERIDSYSSPDYRYKWFSGILYATSIKPIEAIDQFEYVESRVPEEKLHPFFWEDYAYASFLAFMPGRAIDCFDKFSQYEGVNLENNSLYRSLKESFVVPAPDMEIPEEELFQIFERRTGVGFLSRPMGIWIPAQREWIPQFGGYYNNFGALGFQSQGIEDEQGNSITYSIAVYFHINDDDAVSKYTSLAPNVK